MAITLTTSWQKVCEASYQVTSNTKGYVRLYMKYGNRSGLNDTIYYEIRQFAYNPYGTYFAWEYNTSMNWSIKSGNTTKASGSFTQSAIYSYSTDNTSNEVVRASGNYVQAHNSDGTFSDTLTLSAPIYNQTKTATGDIALPTIVVNPTLSVSNNNRNLTTSGVSIDWILSNTGGASTQLQYSTNGSSWADWFSRTGNGNGTNTLAGALLNYFPNTYTAKIYFRATNTNGTSSTQTLSIPIDPNIKPSITSVVINPINSINALSGLFVQNLTKPQIVTTASAYTNGGATISQYDLTALGGYNSFSTLTNVGSSYTYDKVFQKSGNYTATVKVTDTRGGNVSTSSSSITVIPYSNPSIQSIKVERCDSNGTLNDNGTYCKLSVTYNIAPIDAGTSSSHNYKNTKSLSYSINNTTGSITLNDYNDTVSAVIGGGNLSTNSSYPVTIILQDLTTTVTQTTTLPTSFVLVSKRSGGKGIAFGKVAESDNMTIDLDAVFNKTINGINVASWLIHYKNRQSHRAYNNSGNASWYKILRIPSTASYQAKGILFGVSGYAGRKETAIADFSYYNNSDFKAKILSGSITASDLGYIKNNDNSVDIYVYTRQNYNPIVVLPLGVYTGGTPTDETLEWDVWNSTYPVEVSGTPTLTGTFSYTTHS